MKPVKTVGEACSNCDAQLDEQEALERETRATWETFRQSYNDWTAVSGEPYSEFDRIVDGQVNLARVTYQKQRARRELDDSAAHWDRLTLQDAVGLQDLLDQDPQEADVHKFLEGHPEYLVQVLGGGHGRYQLSKKRLGSEFVPDFLVAEMSSIGIEWHAVEIESPRTTVCRQDGLATSGLNHAIGQIRDWRQWLMNNLDYARRPAEQNGLGLVGIDPRLSGLVVIGRRQQYPSRYNEFRRQMIDRERIVIHSFDWLVDVARGSRSGSLTIELKE